MVVKGRAPGLLDHQWSGAQLEVGGQAVQEAEGGYSEGERQYCQMLG